jgi:hypothetical protein
MALYRGNLVTGSLRTSNPVYTDQSLQANLFIICSTLTKILSGPPLLTSLSLSGEVEYGHPTYRHIVEIILYSTDCLTEKYLDNCEKLDLNNMAFINLVNEILAVCNEFGDSLKISQEGTEILLRVIRRFGKFVMQGLSVHGDSLFNCMLLESLTVLHEYS